MKILIVDIETTGFLPNGKICEIGLVELCLETGEKKIILNKVINPDLSKEQLFDSWIVKNNYMSVDEILHGECFGNIQKLIQEKIDSYPDGITAFNRNFDVKFLESYGIKFNKLLPCPMIKSTNICKLPGNHGNYKWPKAEEAYNYFFPESNYVEKHRGADDALHEAEIIYELHKMNCFLD